MSLPATSRWALPRLSVGEFAPNFRTPTRLNARFHFATVAGRYVLLAFVPEAAEPAAMAAFQRVRARMDDVNACAFFVTPRRDFGDVPSDVVPGLRWFLDPEGSVRTLYGPDAGWLLLDPMLRIMAQAPLDAPDALLDQVLALPAPSDYAGTPLVAPVLLVPRVLDPAFCRRLIEHYEAIGGTRSGVMRDIGGRTVGVMVDTKSRRDVMVEDAELKAEIVRALEVNLIPMIARTYHFQVSRLERYLIGCYDAAEGGFFQSHRDNTSLGTAHRKFAVSINLNSEEFEGGDLRFPEFGRRTYRPPTGGAVVFNCSLLHEATPVTRGRRYALLPFLYDEAGQVIRDRNLDKLDTASALAPDKR